jgi:uncharacterized protein DUF4241
MPTGRVVACDPLYCVDTPPFTTTVQPGAYPVILCIAQFPETGEHRIAEPGERRIAAAMLRVQPGPAVRWELAICQEEKEKPADAEAIETAVAGEASYSDGAYCVDSARGAFMDEAAIDAFLARSGASKEEHEGAAWDARVDFLFEYLVEEDHNNLVLDEQSGLNMVIFPSGWGDGEYACYWGLDAHGSPVCLSTDFGIFDEAEWVHKSEAPH